MINQSRVLRQKCNAGSGLLAYLTPKQRTVELDQWHLRVIYGGRQWGKTTLTSVTHARNAIPGATSLAIAPTVTKAQDLLWQGCEQLNRERGAGLTLLRGDHKVLTPNGGVIQCIGVNTLREADKVRGFVAPVITIEECGTYRDELLSFLIDSAAKAATMRYWRNGGRGIAAVGTPSRNVKTYWHRMCLGDTGGSTHFATVKDNPYIPDADGFLRQVLIDNAKMGWTERTPEYRREYLGEFCPDVDSLPYGGWNQVVLPQRAAPEQGWTVMGLDFGQHHPNAWTVYRLTTERIADHSAGRIWTMHKIHHLYAYKQNHMGTDEVAAKTMEIANRFHPNVIVGDGGGGGAQSIFDLQRMFNLPILGAKKAGFKRDRIWMYGSLLSNGTIVVYDETKPWQDEARVTPWNDEKDDHHKGYADHCLDSGLYALEYLQAHMSEQQAAPLPGSPEWEAEQEKKRWSDRMTAIRGR